MLCIIPSTCKNEFLWYHTTSIIHFVREEGASPFGSRRQCIPDPGCRGNRARANPPTLRPALAEVASSALQPGLRRFNSKYVHDTTDKSCARATHIWWQEAMSCVVARVGEKTLYTTNCRRGGYQMNAIYGIILLRRACRVQVEQRWTYVEIIQVLRLCSRDGGNCRDSAWSFSRSLRLGWAEWGTWVIMLSASCYPGSDPPSLGVVGVMLLCVVVAANSWVCNLTLAFASPCGMWSIIVIFFSPWWE